MVKNAAPFAGPTHIIFSVGLKHPSGSVWSCATRLWKTPHPATAALPAQCRTLMPWVSARRKY